MFAFFNHSFTVSFSGFNSLTVLFKRTKSHELSWSTAWNWQFYEHTLYLCSDYLIMRFPERRHWQDTYFSFLSLNHLLFCLGFCLPHIIYKNDKNELWKTARDWSSITSVSLLIPKGKKESEIIKNSNIIIYLQLVKY